jgi:hypothetical protein
MKTFNLILILQAIVLINTSYAGGACTLEDVELAKNNYDLVEKNVSNGLETKYSALVVEASFLDIQACADLLSGNEYCSKRLKNFNERSAIISRQYEAGMVSVSEILAHQTDLIKMRGTCP